MLRMERLDKYYGERKVLDQLSFSVAEGEFFGILGPNGSGKSTLLKLLSGIVKPDGGELALNGSPIGGYTRKQLSRVLAVLQQEPIPPASFTVREVVEMGRYPYQNWLGDDSGASDEIVDAVLDQLNLAELRHIMLTELSGGERQRVALGKAMAQQPSVLLLDEPTTYLDIGYQIQMMDIVKAWQRERKMTVVAVLHDLNLAAMYCDRMLLLHKGSIVGIGTPGELVRGELIRRVYGTKPIVVEHPLYGLPQILLRQGGAHDEP
ncbi:ABC transporter ATP-binding protein [Cohnella panacarvi]|uniref:ABC transporter ATP-binding protein n=1 Tax=Cohnella panacarvi TaxID=400776 RepID=UPI0004B79ED3|nr:ABC transporter ATP-binding protein [Cohnella panacarvi]